MSVCFPADEENVNMESYRGAQSEPPGKKRIYVEDQLLVEVYGKEKSALFYFLKTFVAAVTTTLELCQAFSSDNLATLR